MKNSTDRDDIDMSTELLQQVARQPVQGAQTATLPVLQLAANRHHLAAIMNTDDAATVVAVASKSSLAFILGGNTDEGQTHLVSGTLRNCNAADELLDLQNIASVASTD